jgi:hypothetical protein
MLDFVNNPTFWTAIAAVLVAAISGFWSWRASQPRAEVDAQTAMLAGFTSLLAEFKEERKSLVIRLAAAEKRIDELELLLLKNGIPFS